MHPPPKTAANNPKQATFFHMTFLDQHNLLSSRMDKGQRVSTNLQEDVRAYFTLTWTSQNQKAFCHELHEFSLIFLLFVLIREIRGREKVHSEVLARCARI